MSGERDMDSVKTVGREPDIDDLIERLLDAQQDINLAANTHMSQPLCDASALIDEVESVLRRFAAASPAGAEVVARVKPLVWVKCALVSRFEDRLAIRLADTVLGTYAVEKETDEVFLLTLAGLTIGERQGYPTIEAAKAAAQADYERRILSALEPTPSTDAVRRQAREVADSLENLAGRLEQTATSRELDIATGIREDIAVLRALSTPPAGAAALNEGEETVGSGEPG